MIAIIDYGAGNLNSVKNALDYLEASSWIAKKPGEVKAADAIILPGVGSFGYMMKRLREVKLDIALKNRILDGTPFLGICLGMQVLFEKSEESPGVAGLCIFPGFVKRFRKGKVPQIGWNRIKPVKKSILQESDMYFVNSYYAVPKQRAIIAASSNYYKSFPSAIQSKNITAVQFHPEKSGTEGLKLLARWLKCLQKE